MAGEYAPAMIDALFEGRLRPVPMASVSTSAAAPMTTTSTGSISSVPWNARAAEPLEFCSTCKAEAGVIVRAVHMAI